MDLGIKDRVAVITGGDSGMGLATAKLLAREGVRIILSDQTDKELKEAAEEVRKVAASKDHVVAITCDVTKVDQVNNMAKRVKKEFGGADILCNFAGVRGAAGDFLELSDDDWWETLNTDLMGNVRMCRAFLPHMIEKGWGRVVLIASENALQPYEDESPYNAAKAGVVNLMKCLSRAYSTEGLTINAVSPAYVKTPMTEAMMKQLADERGTSKEEAVDWFLDNERPHIAVDRRGRPEEVAAVVAFLCSEQASYVNGSNYRADGGSVETAFG